ncbi:NrfD/PsrC family molybdoenzyme membrane anchor subunit [Minwuia thermotolerans]|uniref:Hydrogenase n=1 Tax=Minwuia thermotolerans TaxID=2056226 RepID=A0A2M9G329_9PROT|nr:NrfD/PsrC family molybdoenzyme membrane anchor subunit [Minwuia thermotolerans]PJK30104.1 hydrogenase [Minwuia thermotolerans]
MAERAAAEVRDETLAARLAGLVLGRRTPAAMLVALLLAGLLAMAFLAAILAVVIWGVGLFGMNIPVAWTFPIVNTIWWIGMAHAGTLISAILMLTRQGWRAPVTRMAEAMAMFAILMAGIFPLLHLGRPWFFYYLLAYPGTTGLWPQWRSPLVWDFAAILTYLVYTATFLYVSLLPDLATLRDRARNAKAQIFYGLLAMGWRDSVRHWRRHRQASHVLAILAAPIVVTVTGIISLDLAVSIVPGYHFTIFPPYFVAGAIFSGFAAVIMIAVVMRSLFGLHDLVTADHLDRLARLMLGFGLIVNYAYLMEIFTAFYTGEAFYRNVYIDRWTGPYAPVWWTMIVCNVVLLQAAWFRTVRRSAPALFLLATAVNVGMWLERYQIVLTSTHADYVPSAWGEAWPTLADAVVLAGSIGAFVFLLLLFARIVPIVSISEMREAGRS